MSLCLLQHYDTHTHTHTHTHKSKQYPTPSMQGEPQSLTEHKTYHFQYLFIPCTFCKKVSYMHQKFFKLGLVLQCLPWWVGYVCHLALQQILWELAGKIRSSDSGPWLTHWPVQMCSVFPTIRQMSKWMEREPLMQYVIHHTLESVTLESYLQSTRSTFLK